jgi:hypothetical protein
MSAIDAVPVSLDSHLALVIDDDGRSAGIHPGDIDAGIAR